MVQYGPVWSSMVQIPYLSYLERFPKGERQKVMTICTVDVHSRDVVSKMITQKVVSGNNFTWQSQLRHRWDEVAEDCAVNICDAQFQYCHEYLGNTPRLVITPLTDRKVPVCIYMLCW